ncbi:MAG: hypothetical protein MZW92_39650 [Comamonadaceae bacterium]|nr:hypothetical protein [Comamonadaceae bacterium]
MSEATSALPARRWRPPPFIANPGCARRLLRRRAALPGARARPRWRSTGRGHGPRLDRGWQFVRAFLQPDFTSALARRPAGAARKA